MAASPLFDADWYLSTYPDIAAGGVDPAGHYLRVGAAEGRDPGPRFSGRAYLEANPDVARSRVNPLVHFERFGRKEGRLLSPPLPPSESEPAPEAPPVEPTVQRLDVSPDPRPGEDGAGLDEGSREVLERIEAWRHLRRDRRLVAASPFFDRAYYIERNRAAAKAGFDPVDHYLRFGAAIGQDPGPDFSHQAYLAANPDVSSACLNPLVHYERFGRTQGRSLGPEAGPAPRTLAPPGAAQGEASDDASLPCDEGLPDAEVERLFAEGDGIVAEGWALWSAPRLPQVVRVFHEGRLVGQGRVHLSRPDVRFHYPLTPGAIHSGFRVFANVSVHRAQAVSSGLTLEFSDADGRTIRRTARAQLHFRRGEQGLALSPLVEALESIQSLLGRELAVLDWNTGLKLDGVLTRSQVFSPPRQAASGLPYLDRSIDIVIAPDEASVPEARRVATVAVFAVNREASVVAEVWRAPIEAPELPTASILIPAFNHSATTDACLAAVTETLPRGFLGGDPGDRRRFDRRDG